MEPRYRSLMVALAPQPRQMPPPPFDKGALQAIFAEVTKTYPYQGFGFTANERGAQFGNAPDDLVELRPALFQIVAKMDGPDVLTAELARGKVERIFGLAAEQLEVRAFLQCAIEIVAAVDAPGGDAKAFVAGQLMRGQHLAALLDGGFFAGGVRFRDLREPNRPDQDDLSVEPDVNNNSLLFIDYKTVRVAVTGPIGLEQMSTWIDDAFHFLREPTMRLLSHEGDQDAH